MQYSSAGDFLECIRSFSDLCSLAFLTGRLREERKHRGPCEMLPLNVTGNGLITSLPTYSADIRFHGHTPTREARKCI